MYGSPISKTYKFEMSQYEIPEAVRDQHDIILIESNLVDKETILYNLQIVLIIDISGSMMELDTDPLGVGQKGILGDFWTRYDNCVKLVKYMLDELFKYDKDGSIPLFFFNDDVRKEVVTKSSELLMKCRKQKPEGTTNLLSALEQGFKEANDLDNTLFICFTDGVPNQGQVPKIKDLIHKTICKSDPTGDRLNLLFIRMGDDEGAKQFLQDLDDDPVIGPWVDTKSDNATFHFGVKSILLNAIYEELEKTKEWVEVLQKLS